MSLPPRSRLRALCAACSMVAMTSIAPARSDPLTDRATAALAQLDTARTAPNASRAPVYDELLGIHEDSNGVRFASPAQVDALCDALRTEEPPLRRYVSQKLALLVRGMPPGEQRGKMVHAFAALAETDDPTLVSSALKAHGEWIPRTDAPADAPVSTVDKARRILLDPAGAFGASWQTYLREKPTERLAPEIAIRLDAAIILAQRSPVEECLRTGQSLDAEGAAAMGRALLGAMLERSKERNRLTVREISRERPDELRRVIGFSRSVLVRPGEKAQSFGEGVGMVYATIAGDQQLDLTVRNAARDAYIDAASTWGFDQRPIESMDRLMQPSPAR